MASSTAVPDVGGDLEGRKGTAYSFSNSSRVVSQLRSGQPDLKNTVATTMNEQIDQGREAFEPEMAVSIRAAALRAPARQYIKREACRLPADGLLGCERAGGPGHRRRKRSALGAGAGLAGLAAGDRAPAADALADTGRDEDQASGWLSLVT